MDEKISLEAIALYGDSYADKVLKGFFSSKDKITGAEILKLCNVQQVNLFIVKELFRAWKEETKKLKSPYFDFDNEEVKEALENFMAILSQHIQIDQAHFSPLLKKAVSQTLMVIFDPYDFFTMIITGKNNKLDVAPFREEIKYLKINKAPLERMLQKLDEKHLTEISGNEAFAVLDIILEEVNFNPEDVEQYIDKFSEVVPLNPSRFFVSKNPEYKAPPVVPQTPPTPPTPPPTPVAPPTTSAPPPPKRQQPRQELPPSPARTQPPEQEFVPSAIRNEQTARTNQPRTSNSAQQSLPISQNSSARENKPSSIASNLKIDKIKDNLTINQKFMFTKVLFHGDFELFSKAIDRIDQFNNINTALRYIEDEYASTWDNESEEFHEFMELVERRFA